MNAIDLQIQTTASDGKHAPRELVKVAKEQGLSAISITDHDTVGGVLEALEAGKEFGIKVIPGIEMSVEENDAHILGYGINYENKALLGALKSAQESRREGAKKIVQNFKDAGFAIEWADVEKSAGGTVTSPHIVYEILRRPENKEKLGSVSTKHDFYDTFLFRGSPFWVKRFHISAKDAINLIHEANGAAVWSHPVLCFPGNYEALENFLKQLIEWGLDGVEAFNPSHTEDDTEFIQNMALKYKLLTTAGSDLHDIGKHAPNERGLHSADTVGDFETYGFSIEGVMPVLEAALAKRGGKS